MHPCSGPPTESGCCQRQARTGCPELYQGTAALQLSCLALCHLTGVCIETAMMGLSQRWVVAKGKLERVVGVPAKVQQAFSCFSRMCKCSELLSIPKRNKLPRALPTLPCLVDSQLFHFHVHQDFLGFPKLACLIGPRYASDSLLNYIKLLALSICRVAS